MYTHPAALSAGALTVEASLGLPSLRRGAPRVVAGREGLHRPIRWAHSSEVPNIARLLKGGELLLMTGMGVGRAASEQRRFMRGLVESHVAGVIVELGPVFSSLPSSFVEAADEGGMPLVELRREVMFVEVTEEVHSNIVSRQLALLRCGDELQRRLTELLLDGAGIPEILSVLAATIGNPVVLEKLGEGVLYHALHRSGDADALAAWELIRDDPLREARAIVCPVPGSSSKTWGWLASVPIDSPLGEFDKVALEQAVGLVALALLRVRQETLLATRERGNFLFDLISGRTSMSDAAGRAAALGFDSRSGALLPVVLVPRKPIVEAAWTAVWRGFREEMLSRSIPVLLGSRGVDEHTLIVLGIAAPARRESAIELAVEALRRRVEQHAGSSEQCVIAVGSASVGWEQLAEALRQAIDLATLARSAPERPWHDADAASLDGLLLRLRGDARLQQFAALRLAPLLEHDRRRTSKLMPTLRALCSQRWHKSEAARVLHLNRQSLYPRLERIQELLGVDLESRDDRLALELALRMHDDARGQSPA
ncbi:MAG TPA: PucR family transcriptional regulator [Solirubrobacteraceae bacterium]|jgi:purine catabolism regulator|nr:PucR family transcriptional regulator [Solirubrobacteraceae bacterium]